MPDGTTPVRVPKMIRRPGRIKPGTVSSEIVRHDDWLPTLLAAAGEPDIVEKLKKGRKFPPRREPASFTIARAVNARQKLLAKD